MRRHLGVLMVLIAMVSQASATTIVAIRTSDRILMAADSLALDVVGLGKRSNACKIRQTAKAVFAASGLITLSWNNYDANRVIEKAITKTRSLRDAVRRAEDDLQPFLVGALWAFKTARSPWYDVYANRRSAILAFIVCGFEGGVPVCIRREIFVRADDVGWEMEFRGEGCPGDCPADNDFMVASIGETDAINSFLGHSRFIQIDPKGPDRLPVLLEQLVEIEIADKPEHVGLPVDMIEITAGRVRWIKRKADCPAK